jgi:hypothetical protein
LRRKGSVGAFRALLRMEAVFADALALDPALERVLVHRLADFRKKGTPASLSG